MVRRVGLIAALCALMIAGSAQAATTTVVVGQNGNKFVPASLTIATGDTVHWNWASSDHSVTSGTNGTPDGQYDSGILNPPASFDHTFTAPGTYHYFCKLHYSEGMVGTVKVVAPAAPVARFTTSPPAPVAGHSVTFDGSASTAPSGDKIVRYEWAFGDNTTATTTTPTTTYVYSRAGSFTASLTVVDDQQPPQSSSPATHTVKVAVDRPTARFTAKPATITPGKSVAFDGSASKDSDGDTITYQWDFGDGSMLTTASPTASHVYNALGTFKATLTVLDSQRNPSTTVAHTITVKPPPGKPVARFAFSPTHPVTGEPVSFDASKSTDPNGLPITSYRWSFGDKTPLTTPSATVSHVYAHAGTYVVRLVVADSKGIKSAATAERVVVREPPAPVISQLHARICRHAGGRCSRRGIRVRFTLSGGGHVSLAVRRRHHHRVLRHRVIDVGAGNIVVYLRLGHLRRGRYVLAASVSGGNGATARFRVRRR